MRKQNIILLMIMQKIHETYLNYQKIFKLSFILISSQCLTKNQEDELKNEHNYQLYDKIIKYS